VSETSVHLEDRNIARIVFGERDRHIEQIEKALKIQIQLRGTDLTIRGSAGACQAASKLVQELYSLAEHGYAIKPPDVEQALRILQNNPGQPLGDIFLTAVTTSTRNQAITPKTLMQKQYTESIQKNDVVFAWGPAGTGKTYLAMAMAVSFLLEREVDRIILTRPAVEAGEKLGFLPGDLAEKVNPYLRPLYDALHDMMEFEKAEKLVERGVIEVAPLAFMRGRTLNHSFVILDEAQNTTSEQMKMFLTRLGFDSKAVITGDITQIDLPNGKTSGLVEAIGILRSIDGIGFVEFSDRDIVRHPLVQKIISAYDKAGTPRG